MQEAKEKAEQERDTCTPTHTCTMWELKITWPGKARHIIVIAWHSTARLDCLWRVKILARHAAGTARCWYGIPLARPGTLHSGTPRSKNAQHGMA